MDNFVSLSFLGKVNIAELTVHCNALELAKTVVGGFWYKDHQTTENKSQK